MTTEPSHGRQFVLWAFLFEGGLAVVAYIVATLTGEPLLDNLRWDARDALFGLLACVPMLLGFWLCLCLPFSALRRIRRVCDELIGPLFASCSVAELALLSVLAGLGEELLFRGVLQELLTSWWGIWLSVTVVSVVFGLLHALTPTYAVLAGLMGLYLSCVWLWSGNLLVVVVAHGVYDFIALLYLLRRRQRGHDGGFA